MGALLGAGSTACAQPTQATTPEARAALYRERVCSAVVAVYAAGQRPSMVEVELPGPAAGDPPARVLVMAPHLVSAESCLGLPEPVGATLTTIHAPPSEPSTSSAPSTAPLTTAPSIKRPQPLDTRN